MHRSTVDAGRRHRGADESALTCFCCCTGVAFARRDPAAAMRRMQTIDKGDAQQHRRARAGRRPRGPSGWGALWQQHAPERPLPAVDFAKEMVVGVFLGSRPTAGLRRRDRERRRRRRARWSCSTARRGRRRGAITAQVLTSPYHLVRDSRRSHERREVREGRRRHRRAAPVRPGLVARRRTHHVVAGPLSRLLLLGRRLRRRRLWPSALPRRPSSFVHLVRLDRAVGVR